jgi:hypothetical protein
MNWYRYAVEQLADDARPEEEPREEIPDQGQPAPPVAAPVQEAPTQPGESLRTLIPRLFPNMSPGMNMTNVQRLRKILAGGAISPDEQALARFYTEQCDSNDTEMADAMSAEGFGGLSSGFISHARPEPPVPKPDTSYGDMGLLTRSKAERNLLDMFRTNFNLTVVPYEIKLPADPSIGSWYEIDFVIPCRVLSGWKDGTPVIREQVVFIGEYFGYQNKGGAGADVAAQPDAAGGANDMKQSIDSYVERKQSKKLIETFSAHVTGGGNIFVDASSASPRAVMQQLDSHGVIFSGPVCTQSTCVASREIERYKKQLMKSRPSKSRDAKMASLEDTHVGKFQAYVQSAKLQLEFEYGIFKNLSSQMAQGTPEGADLRDHMKTYYQNFDALRQERQTVLSQIVMGSKPQRLVFQAKLEKIDAQIAHLREIFISQYIQQDKQMKSKSRDYKARVAELASLLTVIKSQRVDEASAPVGGGEDTTGRMIKGICDNALDVKKPFNSLLAHMPLLAPNQPSQPLQGTEPGTYPRP